MSQKMDKYSQSPSGWVQSFSCKDLKVLIVCRGPVRKETIDILEALGAKSGILLSEKDSVTYPMTLAPELREIDTDERIHRVPDYMGVTGEERRERIRQIVSIARENGYTHIFAGYGFMAEDGNFVKEIEDAGIGFVGPSSSVHFQAGAKDTAKVIARSAGVSVTPGIDNISALTLIKKANDLEGLKKLAQEKQLEVPTDSDIEKYAEAILHAGYQKGVGLISLEELQAQATEEAKKMFADKPGSRIRLKYIGGGGGKGQRIIEKPEEAANAVLEVLSESKALGEAQNRNFLMELNVENTRHNEIQLLGNGEWAVALGGRDCSLQMHEQKLVELSITDELFEKEIEQANSEGLTSIARQLEKDRKTLQKMEEEAESFGKAVGLDSASTFECIISGNDAYFMEMNTRIQVEHRVTEMVYSLQFTNPENPEDSFVVESLIEAMLLIAAHGKRLPKPKRIVRNLAGGEVRLNAMNDALQPHAGGTIHAWSPPVEKEIRDDQGIGVRNPDTGLFVHYYLAGAYDSNIALIVSYGNSRRENLENLLDILRRMELRGDELKTNREFHLGIVNFCLGLHPMLKPDTKFVVPYLSAVGSLALELENFDLLAAWKEISEQAKKEFGKEVSNILKSKQTLLSRIFDEIEKNPHSLAGWLMRNYRRAFDFLEGKFIWKRNPLHVLNDLYHLFHLESRKGAPPVHQIWEHDRELLESGLQFYADLEKKLGIDTEAAYQKSLGEKKNGELYTRLDQILKESKNDPKNLSQNPSIEGFSTIGEELFLQCRAAHQGWQLGLELLSTLALMGKQSGLLDFSMDENLNPVVPEQFFQEEMQEKCLRALAPPPVASADTIVAVSGGMFYSKETPDSPPYLEVGTHFAVGDPLYIIEVMKMFNKTYAEFSGTVTELLVDGADGMVVKKGQPLFRVKPDEEIQIETEEQKATRRAEYTRKLLQNIL